MNSTSALEEVAVRDVAAWTAKNVQSTCKEHGVKRVVIRATLDREDPVIFKILMACHPGCQSAGWITVAHTKSRVLGEWARDDAFIVAWREEVRLAPDGQTVVEIVGRGP